MKNKIALLAFIFLSTFMINGYAQLEKLSKFTPPDTELLSQEEDKSQEITVFTTYKYSSKSPKENILSFYQSLFEKEGFQQPKDYSPEKEANERGTQYIFTKTDQVALLIILREPENGLNIFYIVLHEPKSEAIKGLGNEE